MLGTNSDLSLFSIHAQRIHEIGLRAPPRDHSAFVVQTLQRKYNLYVWISVCKTIPEAPITLYLRPRDLGTNSLHRSSPTLVGLKFTIHDYLPARRHVAGYIAVLPAPELGYSGKGVEP